MTTTTRGVAGSSGLRFDRSTLLGVAVRGDGLAGAEVHFVSKQDGFRDFAHRLARVHARLPNAMEGLGFSQTVSFHQHSLRALHNLARLKRFFKVANFLLERAELFESR